MCIRDRLTDCEPARAAKFGMAHYTWLCINPKEAQDVAFARDVMKLIPELSLIHICDGELAVRRQGEDKRFEGSTRNLSLIHI